MNRVGFADAALEDLDRIWSFIADDSIEQADHVLHNLYRQFEELAEYPGKGRPCAEFGAYMRRYPIMRRFVVFYRQVDSGVHLARVFDGAQDIDSMSEEDFK